jgi:hypothetical protein
MKYEELRDIFIRYLAREIGRKELVAAIALWQIQGARL